MEDLNPHIDTSRGVSHIYSGPVIMPHVAFGGLLGPDEAATPTIFEVTAGWIEGTRWLGLATIQKIIMEVSQIRLMNGKLFAPRAARVNNLKLTLVACTTGSQGTSY